MVPPITEWKLVQCDINNDVEITDKAQLTFPDIQLEGADRVFRLYVKSLHYKAVYRCEESLAFNDTSVVEVLDQIRNPIKALNKIDNIAAAIIEKQLSQKIDSILNCKAIGYNEINN
jgi:hypothetical protein